MAELEYFNWEDLQNETKQMLEMVRGKPKGKSNDKKLNKVEPPKKAEHLEEKVKSKKKKSKLEKSLELSRQLDDRLERATVEILDDASPEGTPRVDEQEARMRTLHNDQVYMRGVKTAEESFRKMNFSEEKNRVMSKMDIFVSNPRVTREDVEIERRRLARLEESARVKRIKSLEEKRDVTESHARTKASTKIQAMFRARVGKQKFILCKKLRDFQLQQEGDFDDEWVEVVDPVHGDRWYYNKTKKISQYDKPHVLIHKHRNESRQPVLLGDPNTTKKSKKAATGSPEKQQGREKVLSVSMSVPSLKAVEIGKRANGIALEFSKTGDFSPRMTRPQMRKTLSFDPSVDLLDAEEYEYAAKREVEQMMGLDKLSAPENLIAPDGTFKQHLRTTVLDALLETRFDSVSSVLADPRWFEETQEPFAAKKKSAKVLSGIPEKHEKEDVSRKHLVAPLSFNKKKSVRSNQIESSDIDQLRNNERLRLGRGDGADYAVKDVTELNFKEVEHNGFENPTALQNMCFGCWSSGFAKKCDMHDEGIKLKSSQTMLLCRNWELDVMRRRYRSEEIQEVFLQKDASLRFDVKHKKFSTVQEQRHPIYRCLNEVLEKFNNRMTLFEKIKRWMLSLSNAVYNGKLSEDRLQQIKLMRLKRNLLHHSRIDRYTKTNHHLLPVAPITGFSWHERLGNEQYLFKHHDFATSADVDLITILPLPVPKLLYLPRECHVTVPKSIPMPQPSYQNATGLVDGEFKPMSLNAYIEASHPMGWMERLTGSIIRDAINAAKVQIKAVTPVTTIDMLERTKKPVPSTIKFATIGQKPTPGNLAVGGLALELLVNQLISTYFPAQYGNFMVMDKSTVSPGVSPEVMITFASLVMAPIVQQYVDRPLEHPLNYRRAPTITLNSSVSADDRHFYGINRPEQTGEQDSHGFRTTAWAPMLLTYTETDPQVFIPGQGVVSLNTPKANISYTTHADVTYPFCEPSTRDNSTLDFYHLLLTGVVSFSKPQVFTALTVQEPGTFLKNYRSDLPMGHLVVSVYRSWAFTQSDTIQEFKTDDGVSYWYHRKTGQTFWERPLYTDEEVSPLNGGLTLDLVHQEEPTQLSKGTEGATRRYLQGQFRDQMLMHIETKKDALNRRKSASVTVKAARERGIIPELTGLASLAVNQQDSSIELGSRFDFNVQNNSSLLAQTEDSNFSHHGLQNTVSNVDSNNNRANIHAPFDQNMMTINAQQQANNKYSSHDQTAAQFHSGHGGAASNQHLLGSHLDQDGSMLHTNSQNQFQNNEYPSHHNLEHSNSLQEHSLHSTSSANNRSHIPLAPGLPGIDANLMTHLSSTIGAMLTGMMTMDKSNPQEMIQFGLGMGMALMSTGAVGGIVQNQINPNSQSLQEGSDYSHGSLHNSRGMPSTHPGAGVTGDMGFIPSIAEEETSNMSVVSHGNSIASRVSTSKHVSIVNTQQQPIGLAHPTEIFSADKVLDHMEQSNQRDAVASRIYEPLNTMERARNLVIEQKPTETPDVAPPKVLTDELPPNAEQELRDKKTLPVLAYPELSTQVAGGGHIPYSINPPAGLGTSFVSKEEEQTQLTVKDSNLRRAVMPLPVGFFETIEAKHLAKQVVDYLPQVPNLPQSRTIGRVKPRSAAADWLMISFDPWSAGKNPLGTEFVPSLMANADKLIGNGGANAGSGARAAEAMDTMRQNTLGGAYVNVQDEQGLSQQRAEISKAQHLAEDFRKLCSLCRHSKFSDAEQLINQPEWSVPIDYQDDQGNTLLHIVAQNGNKRLVKLCLRRGALLNLQNLTGQTPLHFAFGYGYSEVGDYLVGKGADDSIKNKDGLTCYEGLAGKELAML